MNEYNTNDCLRLNSDETVRVLSWQQIHGQRIYTIQSDSFKEPYRLTTRELVLNGARYA